MPNTAPVAGLGQAGTQHYENFPVASWLCPPALRPAILAIYQFARCADDIADEGDASAEQRLQELGQYRHALNACLAANNPPVRRWAEVFVPLANVIAQHQLPAPLLNDLISAFEQDVRYTAQGRRYRDHAELLDYCRLSANPVGRLLLHLYGVNDRPSLERSDQICSALQLINFWQDLSVDLPRQRHYLPSDQLLARGVDPARLTPDLHSDAAAEALVASLCQQARTLMLAGAPLALQLPGRAGWELRLVVQGGLLILDRAATLQHRTWHTRPRLRAWDLPRLLWRAARMTAA
ncbi:MAG: squalene synthase HpnC [Hydrogenophaga sp.]|nr:squalene synthase HpnC [Hydrogenophaga sp.]